MVTATAELGWLNAERTTPSKTINSIIDGFENAFGGHKDIRVVTEPVTDEAKIEVTDFDGIS